MLNGLFITLLVLHGAIHFMGLGNAYRGVPFLRLRVGKAAGWLWAIVAALFFISAGMRIAHADTWWLPAIPAVVISQMLIIRHWLDARFGTVANALIAIAVVLGILASSFRRAYDRASELAVTTAIDRAGARISEQDIASLPGCVQRYLRASGVMGMKRPRMLRMEFEGEIRSKEGAWMPFTSTQVNTFDPPTRSFWMAATMKGLPVKGWHHYADGVATMQIKVLGAIPVIDVAGPQLDTTETVTWLNDLCLYAPGALIDPRIRWLSLDDHRAKATFSHKGIIVQAVLEFDEEGHLVDFISKDRSYLEPDGSMTRRRFTTPVDGRVDVNGVLLPAQGEAIWHLPDGPFIYGRFHLKHLAYDPPT